MKKLLAIATAAVSLAGCMKAEPVDSADRTWTDHGRALGRYVVTKVVEIEGHRYVLMSGLKQGGIVHAESCPCRSADAVRYKKTVVDGKTWLVPECGRGTAGIPLTE